VVVPLWSCWRARCCLVWLPWTRSKKFTPIKCELWRELLSGSAKSCSMQLWRPSNSSRCYFGQMSATCCVFAGWCAWACPVVCIPMT
jgi:hypothetical protein